MKEGAERAFLVTDQVIRDTGLVDRVASGVEDGGLEVAGVFDEVPQDSSTAGVERCAAAAKEAGADSFLAVGGGSVMDTTKVAATVFTHGGTVRDYEGAYTLPRPGGGQGAPPATTRAPTRSRGRTTAWGPRSRSLRSHAFPRPRAPDPRSRSRLLSR